MQSCILFAICVLLASASGVPANTSVPTTSTNASIISNNGLLSSSTIPPGYTYYAATGSYYKYHKWDSVSWDVANTTCASEGAHVVVVNDAEEADIVVRVITDTVGFFGNYHATWTGLRDNRQRGVMEWRTVHGEPLSDVYNVWYVGEPHNDVGRRCAVFGATTKQLYGWPCDWERYFMCEISRKIANNTTML